LARLFLTLFAIPSDRQILLFFCFLASSPIVLISTMAQEMLVPQPGRKCPVKKLCKRLSAVNDLLLDACDEIHDGPPAKSLLELLKIAKINFPLLDNHHQQLSKKLEQIVSELFSKEKDVEPYLGKTPNLNSDVLGCVLQMLDWTSIANARLVCKRWAQAARKPIAWRYAVLTLQMDAPHSIYHNVDDPATMAALIFTQSARLIPAPRKTFMMPKPKEQFKLFHHRAALFQRNFLAGRLVHLHTLEMNWRCLSDKMVFALWENTTLRHLKIDRHGEGVSLIDARRLNYAAIIKILENNKHLLTFEGFRTEDIYMQPPLGVMRYDVSALVTLRTDRLGRALAKHPTLQKITLPAIQRDPAEYKTERDTFAAEHVRSYIPCIPTWVRDLALQNILGPLQGRETPLKQVVLKFNTSGVVIGDVAAALDTLGWGVERVVVHQTTLLSTRNYSRSAFDDRPGCAAFQGIGYIDGRVELSFAFHNMLLDRANEQLLQEVLRKPEWFRLELHLPQHQRYWEDSYKQLCEKHPEFKKRVTLL
jgi:hypothetical protein